MGDSGELEVDVAATAVQGAVGGMIQATSTASDTNQPVTVMLPLSAFVTGTNGAVDTTWTQPALPTLPLSIALAADDSFYVLLGCDAGACAQHIKTDGTLDTDYGTGGTASIPQQAPSQGAIAPDGSFVVGGGQSAIQGPTWVAKLTTKGKLDTSFNGTGVFSFTGTPGGGYPDQGMYSGGVNSLEVLSNGNIVFGWYGMTLSELAPDGTLVTGFGSGGTTVLGTTSLMGIALRPAGTPSGLVLVSIGPFGSSKSVYFLEVDPLTAAAHAAFPGGTPKSTSLADLNQTVSPSGVTALPDGSVFAPILGDAGIYVFKFDTNGNLVTSFGAKGTGISDPIVVQQQVGIGQPTGIAIQADGKVLVASQLDGTLYRLTAGGTADTAFGMGGSISNKLLTSDTMNTWSQKVVVQKAGRIVVGGITAAGGYTLFSYWP